MTFVNDFRKSDAGLIDRLSAYLRTRRADRQFRAEQDRMYRKTLNELKSLSNRDLADIGLHRSAIEGIAFEAAYGK